MPLKFKLYYASSLYLLIWSAWLFLYGSYETFTDDHTDGNFIYDFLALFLIALIIFKAILSLKATCYYKNSISYSKSGKIVFIIGFCINVVLFIGILLLCIFVIIPDFRQERDYDSTPSYETRLMSISFVITVICSAYLCIFDLILLKAISKKQRENLLSFELETNDPM